MNSENLWVDLAGLELEDVEILSQEGGRGMPEFAASTGVCDSTGTCSCGVEELSE